jgi:hypothetical protein
MGLLAATVQGDKSPRSPPARQTTENVMASKSLVRLAKAAAKASAKANAAQQAWVDAFEAEYGHNDISDVLVSVIDYASGEGDHGDELTAEFIDAHSAPGMS